MTGQSEITVKFSISPNFFETDMDYKKEDLQDFVRDVSLTYILS